MPAPYATDVMQMSATAPDMVHVVPFDERRNSLPVPPLQLVATKEPFPYASPLPATVSDVVSSNVHVSPAANTIRPTIEVTNRTEATATRNSRGVGIDFTGEFVTQRIYANSQRLRNETTMYGAGS